MREGKGELGATLSPLVEMMAAHVAAGIEYSAAGIIPDTATASIIAQVRRVPILDCLNWTIELTADVHPYEVGM